MSRREPATLNEQRHYLARRYKGGSVGSRSLRKTQTPEEYFDVDTLMFKRAQAVFLKASDYSNTYISESLGITRGAVGKWFEEPKMLELVTKARADMVDGAINYAKTMAIEMFELIAEIARKSLDDGIALKAAQDVLDRIGLTKVNKSESHQHRTDNVSISGDEDFLSRIEGLPLETQHKLAELSTQFKAVIEEAKGRDV